MAFSVIFFFFLISYGLLSDDVQSTDSQYPEHPPLHTDNNQKNTSKRIAIVNVEAKYNRARLASFEGLSIQNK